jgi:hypothetical protein
MEKLSNAQGVRALMLRVELGDDDGASSGKNHFFNGNSA